MPLSYLSGRALSMPRLLDLFCGAGGAAVGYHRAGFDVVGVDLWPQPNYPFEFVQGDALTAYALGEFDAIHASPPCQAFTAYKRTGIVGWYPDLISETRTRLQDAGVPYVIENVVGAPLEDPLLLCGSMFDLDVQRHRLFESNVPLEPPVWPCRHKIWAPDRYPGGRSVERTGKSTGLVRACVEVGSWDIPFAVQQAAMGVDWMTLEELSEAVPPAYTQHIGGQLLAHLDAVLVSPASPEGQQG
jgi:DNA (cytosine-5)-methyltransferase 1